MAKSNLCRKWFISLTHPCHQPSWREVRAGTQDRNVELGTGAEAIEEQCLLFPHWWLSFLSYILQDHLPGVGTIQTRMGPPTSTSQPGEGSFSTDTPSSQIIPNSVTLTKQPTSPGWECSRTIQDLLSMHNTLGFDSLSTWVCTHTLMATVMVELRHHFLSIKHTYTLPVKMTCS